MNYEEFVFSLSGLPFGTGNVGKSWLCREIKYVKVGFGSKVTVVVGDFAANSSAAGNVLMRWLNDAGKAVKKNGNIGDFRMDAFAEKNTVYVVPLPNPDGDELCRSGIDESNPFCPRVKRINKNSENFSEWSANIRGIDLERNFNARWLDGKMFERKKNIFMPSPSGYGGEFPESELESASLCYFIRKTEPSGICVLRSGKRSAEYFSGTDVSGEAERKARFIAKLSGIPVGEIPPERAAGSICGWAELELSIPAVQILVENAEKDYEIYRDILTVAAAI